MRRLVGGAFVVLGAVLLLHGGMAAAAGPSDPVSQDVAVDGSEPEDGVLVFGSRSRNESCSVTRNVLNRTARSLRFEVLDAGGATLVERQLAAGGQVTFVIDHAHVTVPLLLRVGDDAPVELAQVGPYPPCDAPATTAPPVTAPAPTVAPPAVPDTPADPAPPAPPSSPEAPPVTTLTPGPTTPISLAPPTTVPVEAGEVPLPTVAPTSLATAPSVSVLGVQVTSPGSSVGRLPTTGADARPTVAIGTSAIAVGLAFVLTSRQGRRRRAELVG